MLSKTIQSIVDKAEKEGVFSRCSVGVLLPGFETVSVSKGTLGESKISEHTLFDCASVTKVIPTSLLALKALDTELITLDTVVNNVSPRISLKSATPVTLRHLLTQTVEFPFALSELKDLPASDLLKKITHAEIKTPPGTKFAYCNATSIILAIVVEELFSDSLYTIAERELFMPLEMGNSHFKQLKSSGKDIVPTEIDEWRGETICGEVHDESAWKLSSLIDPGAAGLFSSSEDLLKVISMVIRDDGSFISQGLFQEYASNWIPNVTNDCTGLGFEYNQKFMGELQSKSTVGKTGFTGSSITIDHERKAGVAILTDYTWPKRKKNRDQIIRFRREIADCIWNYVDEGR